MRMLTSGPSIVFHCSGTPFSTSCSILIACGWDSSCPAVTVSTAGFLLNFSGRLHVHLKVSFLVGFSRLQVY